MTPRVLHPPIPEPAPTVTPNLHRAGANWAANRERAKQLVDWEDWRERARVARADAVEHLPELLAELEERVIAAGGVVHHAATGEEANAIVAHICRERGATLAVKGKSMTSEETGLNEALARAGVEAVETDLGEWVVQLLDDRPSHILAPAVHLSAAQIADVFAARSGRAFDPEDTQSLVAYARAQLRERFLRADVGITGVNLAVAETGTLVLVESEGNLRLTTSAPPVHIAVMGVEKVVRDWEAAQHLVQMLPLAAHGKLAAGSTSFITGPARGGDDGPQELHLVLLDDGRMAMRDGPLSEALQCIRCGACLHVCPVYRQVGGHNYGSVYPGPIGAVVTPGLEDGRDGSGDLAWLSSLCGACTEACPVKIPLDEQLVTIRAMTHEREPAPAEQALFAAWGRLWSRPAAYRATAATGGRALAPLWARLARAGADDGWLGRVPFPFSGWTSERDVRAPAAEPFHARWRRRRGGRPTPQPTTARGAGVPPDRSFAEGAGRSARPAAASPPARGADLPARFRERMALYDGTVHEAASLAEARALARQLVAGAPVSRWADEALDGIADGAEAPPEEAEVSLVVADVGVAFNGTIVFAHGPARPRLAGVLPERQIALLARADLVATTAEALARFFGSRAAPPSNVVLVGGPSRTADIEQRSIRGVHAPRELDVIVYEAP